MEDKPVSIDTSTEMSVVDGQNVEETEPTEEPINPSQDKEMEKLKGRIVLLEEENTDIRTKMANLQMSLDRALRDVEATELARSKLEKENGRLRQNLLEYQKSLDRCEITQEASQILRPVSSPKGGKQGGRRKSLGKKSAKTIKKTDIQGPDTESFLHVSGARMEDGNMTIINNSGLLDPRIRKLLAVAGVDESEVMNDPNTLIVVDQFAKENNVFEKLRHMSTNRKKRSGKGGGKKEAEIREEHDSKYTPFLTAAKQRWSTRSKIVVQPAPPPPPPAPPLPPPPQIVVNRVRVGGRASADGSGSTMPTDLNSLILNQTHKLKPVQQNLEKGRFSSNNSSAEHLESDELLLALRKALHNIVTAVGDSEEDESVSDDF